MSNTHIAIICNPLSGRGRPVTLLNEVTHALTSKQITYQVFKQQLPDNLQGFSQVIIMGGDGTINYTLNHFKHINIPIGIIPCGTGNDAAKLLLGERSLSQYIETALYGTPKLIDAGTCNHQLFLNGVGIGFDGWVAKLMQGKKWLKGKAGYHLTVLRLLLLYKETNVEIWLDGEKATQEELFMLSAANGITYGGGFKVAPFAQMNDGWLEVITVKKISLFSRVSYLPAIEKGQHLNKPLPFIAYRQAKQIVVKSEEPLQAHLDGEWMQANDFTINILPAQYLIRC